MKNWLSKFAFTFSLYRYTAWEKRASEEEQAGKLATEMSLDEAKADGGDAMDHDGGGGGGGGGVDAAAAAAAAVEPVHTTATATAATPAATPAPGAADGAEEEEAATDEAAAAVRTYPDDASPSGADVAALGPYRLHGVISHLGSSPECGHYVVGIGRDATRRD
jgi:hypothetical protein